MAQLFLIFLDQICPKWIKLDQTIGGFSFKCFLDYFQAEKVKYWPNMPELLTDNIC